MVRAVRQVDRVEFVPADIDRVVGYMDLLAAARDGWLNLLPGIDEENVSNEPAPGILQLFGGGVAKVAMCTWLPQGSDRRHHDESVLGIMHGHGRFAADRLKAQSLPVPEGWRVEQDHARRGLILAVPTGAVRADVLAWALRATAMLCELSLTGKWLAEVHLPRT